MRVRTGYSFRQASGNLGDVFERVKLMGFGDVAPISDRASAFGWVKWNKLCKKAGVRPLFGVELAVTNSLNAKKAPVDYWTFFAKDDLADVNRLISLATAQFYYEPLLTYDQAQVAKGVMRIVGNRAQLDDVMPSEDTFIGLSPSVNRAYYRQARAMGLMPIATSDNRYTVEKDKSFYEVVAGRGASIQTYPQWLLTPEEWASSVAHIANPVEQGLAQGILSERLLRPSPGLREAVMLVPERPSTLREMCEAGAQKLGCDLTNPDYAARLTRELDMIASKSFEDYFYIIADMVQWARQRMIVGPARGSSCGSLACYLLEITTIDPLKYGLIFERFIDINRNDLPDIDIDFSEQKRKLVFEYAEQKYGKEHVARLGTVAMYKSKSAMQEASAAIGVPRWRSEKVLDTILKRSSGDSRALDTLRDALEGTTEGRALVGEYPGIVVCQDMEGHPRHSGQHAAGIVITADPVNQTLPVDSRTGATMCDKKDAEDIGLLKIDALGLTQLTVFENSLAMAGLPMHHLESVPLDDPKALKVLADKKFSGVFQFNGPALKSIANGVPISSIDDIINLTALARPGPIASGGTSSWARRKNGVEPITYPHPAFEPYLAETSGVVVYQEQVMLIGREIGGLSWEDVTDLRKAMSKSLGKEFFDRYGERWKAGAKERITIDEQSLNKIWDDLCAYGSWCFNKSHSVAYGVISYWCAWLKAHHPVEFAAATLQEESDPDRQLLLLRELHDEGIGYIPFDKDQSGDRWMPGRDAQGNRSLIGPLSNVKGIGPKVIQSILSSRARGEPLPAKVEKIFASNPTTSLDSLWPIRDAFHNVMPVPAERNIHSSPTRIGKINAGEVEFHKEYLLFGVFSKINRRDENEAVNIAKRGGEVIEGDDTLSVTLRIMDDTGVIFGKIGRWDFKKLGIDVINRGRPSKELYAVKGMLRGDVDFPIFMVKMVRHIGSI